MSAPIFIPVGDRRRELERRSAGAAAELGQVLPVVLQHAAQRLAQGADVAVGGSRTIDRSSGVVARTRSAAIALMRRSPSISGSSPRCTCPCTREKPVAPPSAEER